MGFSLDEIEPRVGVLELTLHLTRCSVNPYYHTTKFRNPRRTYLSGHNRLYQRIGVLFEDGAGFGFVLNVPLSHEPLSDCARSKRRST
jgi:hypothetical protein